MSLPDDVASVREASRSTGVSVDTIRQWIYTGKGGVKLGTYRVPETPSLVLVSPKAVLAFRDKKTGKTRRVGRGPVSVHLIAPTADELRELARLMGERLGVCLSPSDVMRTIVADALRRERKNAEASS